MAKSPEEMANAMIANFKDKTGKTLQQWIAIAKKSGAAKHGEIVKMLKTDHGMTHGFANLVAHKTLKSDAGSIGETTDLVAAQYAGDKAELKPIYDALIKAAKSCGAIEIAPKKAYVSLRRSKQFAIIQPSTKTRVDLGLNLKGDAGKRPSREIRQLQRDGQPPRAARKSSGCRQGRQSLDQEGLVGKPGRSARIEKTVSVKHSLEDTARIRARSLPGFL